MTFREAYDQFQQTRERLKDYGARDSEIGYAWEACMRRCLQGKDASVPQTARDWSLYDMPGDDIAAASLTQAAEACVEHAKEAGRIVALIERRPCAGW